MPKLTRRHANRNRIVITVVVAALVGAGCGGGTTKNSVKNTTSTSASTSTTTTIPATTSTVAPSTSTSKVTSTVAPPVTIDPALAAKAAAAVFKPADFPYGYTAQPPDPTSGLQIARLWKTIAPCLGVDNTPPTPLVATSPTFKSGLATQAVSAVEYTTPSSAASIAAALGGPKVQACLTSAFNANSKLSAPQGATPSPATVTLLAVPPVGAKTIAFRVNVTMNLGSLQIKLFHDFLVVFKGSAVIRTWFLNPGSGFPPDLEHTLVADVVGRS